jgi:hypothetical protein
MTCLDAIHRSCRTTVNVISVRSQNQAELVSTPRLIAWILYILFQEKCIGTEDSMPAESRKKAAATVPS